jgi:membrane protease YdiL (CAAX protease family)
LLGPLFTSIPGILTLGLAAALGEEIIFRGALLPRFGLIYTSILFALVHANYGISAATLVVFLLALVLSLVRYRYNTTVCMIIHATYNISLGILSLK